MTASTKFRSRITAFLTTGDQDLLAFTSESEWRRNLYWLDRSGLALPLAVAVQPSTIPPAINDALQMRIHDNAARMEMMLQFFDEVNNALASTGVTYACVKGFSLIPDCFTNLSERHQLDLDFLLLPQDAERGVAAIEAIGYRRMYAAASGEVRLTKPWKKLLGVKAYMYDQPEPTPVELHTHVWERETIIDIGIPDTFLETLEMREVRGVQFPCLNVPHHFIYLLLHMFRHLIGSWGRLLSFYEVALLLRRRENDIGLWTSISELIEEDARLASVCALVLGMVNVVFPAELPAPLRRLYARHLSAESALWLQEYASKWLYCDPHGTKIGLLVQKQFCTDDHVWKQYLRQRLMPMHRLNSLDEDSRDQPGKSLAYRLEEAQYRAGRIFYHFSHSVEYLAARVRWERLMHARPAAAHGTLREI